MDRTYTGSFGRLKAGISDLLPEEFVLSLIPKDLEGISQALSSTSYREDLEALSALYKAPEILEMAINRHLIKKNKLALFAPPPNASTFLKSYFLKWDIENVKAVMSAKQLGYHSSETDSFIVSYRNVPVGIFAGNMTQEDFKIMISLGSIENVVDYLTRFGIGTYLLQYIDEYRKTKDVTPLFSAMDRYHFQTMTDSLRFFNGDEITVRSYIRSLVDEFNITTIFKAMELKVPWEQIKGYVFNGGDIPTADLEDSMRSMNIADACQRLKNFYDMNEAVERYEKTGMLYHFDISLRSERFKKFLPMLAASPISLNSIFYFTLRAEMERENLRAIIAGKIYKVSDEGIRSFLILV